MNNKISLPPITDILNNKYTSGNFNTNGHYERLGTFNYKYLNNNANSIPLPTISPISNHLQSPGASHLNSYISDSNVNVVSRSSSVSSASNSMTRSPPSNIDNSPRLNSLKTEPQTQNKIQLPNNITANKVSTNEKKKTRSNLPKGTTYILLNWLNNHLNHPYPNNFEKNQLMVLTGLNQQQLSNWFINARRRKIKSLKQKN